MAPRFIVFSLSMVLTITLVVPSVALAQFGSIGRRLADAVSDQVGDEVEDLLRDGVRCAFSDTECIEQARAEGKTPVMVDRSGEVMTDNEGRPITDPAAAAAMAGPADAGGATAAPGTGVWVNYDFVPGDQILVYDDYTDDTVGDFPRRFDLLAGNWEVAQGPDQRFIRNTGAGTVSLELPETLPERFTLEFPVSVSHGNGYLFLSTAPINHGDRDFAGSALAFRFTQAGIYSVKGEGPQAMTRKRDEMRGDPLGTFRVMADDDYFKVYVDDHRVANVPNAVFPRTNTLYFTTSSASEARPILIGPIRIAAGGRDLYDRLEADGRVATQGVLFAVDSDVIRPESTPTLEEIGAMLTEHADLQLTIEGHTDSDGDEAHNLDLSRRRAEAVKAYLVERHRVDEGRLDTQGFGESQPAVDNGTPEGKAQNRRVELVRQDG